MGKRLALIIGNSVYQDETLARLKAPDVDVGALRDVLIDSQVGGFDEVELIFNSTSWNVRIAISDFFSRKSREDLLLLYFSGHGVLDQNGRLYLAVKDTDHDHLRANGIPATFIADEMDNSRSKRQILILDCCHSGAFTRGVKGSPGITVGTASAFGAMGVGRVVLTATDATQYAWEGDRIIGEAQGSLFTHFLVKGLQTGQADYDQDGRITVNELYEYIYDQVLKRSPHQTPSKWSSKVQGEIVIAQTPGMDASSQFSFQLQPEKLSAEQIGHLTITNLGSTQKTFHLALQDDDGKLDFSPPRTEHRIPAGQSSSVEFRAWPRQRPIIGRPQSYRFIASISLPRGGSQTRAGEVVAGGILPLWILPLVTVLGLLGILVVGTWINGRNPLSIAANTMASVETTQPSLPTLVTGQVQNATHVVANATAFSSPSPTLIRTTAAPLGSSPSPEPSFKITSTPGILQLTTGIGNNYSPQFSPDGNRIVFLSTRDGNPEIYIMNSDGTDQRRLTNTPNISEDVPSFSPDESLIIYSAFDGHDDEIFVLSIGDGQVRNISNSSSTNEARPKFVSGTFVSLSVVFDSDRPGNWEIYLAAFGPDGLGPPTQITNRPQHNDRLPSYIHSSQRILFRSEEINEGSQSSRIYSIGLDGSDLKKLSGENPDWYPVISYDNRWVLFVSGRDGNDEIYAMNPEGGDSYRLTNNSIQDTTPALSPDGKWLVFASKVDGTRLHLFRVPFITSSP